MLCSTNNIIYIFLKKGKSILEIIRLFELFEPHSLERMKKFCDEKIFLSQRNNTKLKKLSIRYVYSHKKERN